MSKQVDTVKPQQFMAAISKMDVKNVQAGIPKPMQLPPRMQDFFAQLQNSKSTLQNKKQEASIMESATPDF
jgi:hypothetical protein